MAVFQLEGKIRDYAWGTRDGISSLLGLEPQEGPEAELWMGAHPGAPSRLIGSAPALLEEDLLQLLQSDPGLLGDGFDELPYLFKVLAAASPLSLQVHPSKKQAEAGFEREEREGIPLSVGHRCYKDRNHKPELMMALTPFAALCGFVSPELTEARLRYYGLLDLSSPLALDGERLLKDFSSETLSAFFGRLFELSEQERDGLLQVVRSRVERDVAADGASQELEHRAAQLFLSVEKLKRFSERLVKIHDTYPGDPGVFGALLLNWVELNPGEALYLPAGVLHSYLDGVGLEIMASSDNVLRGGLTSKHVSLSELKRTVDFSSQEPQLILPRAASEWEGASVSRYETPAPEFELSLVTLEGAGHFTTQGPDVLLVLEGEVEVFSSGRVTKLQRGQQAFCSGDESYRLVGKGRIARASPNPRALSRTKKRTRHDPSSSQRIAPSLS